MPDAHQPPKPHPVNLGALHSRWEHDRKSRLFLQLAEEYRKQDFVDSAIEVLKEGLQHHPHWIPARVALARCHLAKTQLAEAQSELERIHAKHPDNLLAGRLLVEVHEERGQQVKALKVLKSLLPFAPDDAELSAHLAGLEEAVSPPVPTGEHPAVDTAEFHTSEFAERRGKAAAPAGRAVETAAPARAPNLVRPGPSPVLLDLEEGEPLELVVGDEGEPAEGTPGGPPGEPVAETLEVDDIVPEPVGSGEEIGETVVLPAGGATATREDEEPETVLTAAGVAAEPAADETGEIEGPFGAEEAPPPAVATPALPKPSGPPPRDLLRGAPARKPAGDEEDEFASVTLAELYESQGAFAEAAAIYERLLAHRPADAELQRALSRCRTRLAGGDPGSKLVAAVTSPPPAPKAPRWQPVRPRPPEAQPVAAAEPEAAEQAPLPAAAAAGPASAPAGAPPPRPVPTFGKRAPAGGPPAPNEQAAVGVPVRASAAAPSPQNRRAVLAELHRWLAAIQAVRQ